MNSFVLSTEKKCFSFYGFPIVKYFLIYNYFDNLLGLVLCPKFLAVFYLNRKSDEEFYKVLGELTELQINALLPTLTRTLIGQSFCILSCDRPRDQQGTSKIRIAA